MNVVLWNIGNGAAQITHKTAQNSEGVTWQVPHFDTPSIVPASEQLTLTLFRDQSVENIIRTDDSNFLRKEDVSLTLHYDDVVEHRHYETHITVCCRFDDAEGGKMPSVPAPVEPLVEMTGLPVSVEWVFSDSRVGPRSTREGEVRGLPRRTVGLGASRFDEPALELKMQGGVRLDRRIAGGDGPGSKMLTMRALTALLLLTGAATACGASQPSSQGAFVPSAATNAPALTAPPTRVPVPTLAPVRTVAPAPTPTLVAPPLFTVRPAPALPQGVRIGAICRDGSRSSATGSGACSHHGGVAQWLLSP